MISLSQALIQAKNQIESNEAWLICFDFVSPNSDLEFYLVMNNEDVTINGRLYQAFPLELDEIAENNTGGIGQFSIKVSNIDRVVQQYVEQDATFGSGWNVKISVYHTSQNGGTPEIEHNFISLNCTADINWVVFTIGVENPLKAFFPHQVFSGGLCQRTFKDGVGCPYAGADTECSKTLDSCKTKFPDYRTRRNSSGQRIGLPFLAFIGIPRRAIYV